MVTRPKYVGSSNSDFTNNQVYLVVGFVGSSSVLCVNDTGQLANGGAS